MAASDSSQGLSSALATFIVLVVVLAVFARRLYLDLTPSGKRIKAQIKEKEEASRREFERLTGHMDSKIVCPHCHEKGSVHTERVKLKRGISGGKVTAALLTGGLSMLGAGLSRKEDVTEARCSNCGSVWHFS